MLGQRWLTRHGLAGRERLAATTIALLTLIVFLAPLVGQERPDYVGAEAHRQGDQWVVTFVDPAGPAAQAGLRQGDIVLALDEGPLARRRTDPGLALERAQRWTVWRGEAVLVLERSTTSTFWFSVVEPNLMLVAALLFWVLATFVCLSKPTDPLARQFGWLNLTIATVLALSPAGAADLVWARLVSIVAFGLLPGLSLSFFAHFSRGSPATGLVATTNRLLLASGLLMAGLYISVNAFGSAWHETVRLILLGLVVIGWLASLIVLVQAYRRPASPTIHLQLKIVLVGTAIALLPLVLLSQVPLILGQPSVLRPQLASFSLIALPASFAYAILRHGALEIELVLERTLIHGAMSLLLASGYGLFFFGLSQVGGGVAAPPHPLLVFAFFVAVTLTFIPVRQRVHRLVDRVLFGDRYDHIQTLRTLGAQLASQRPIDQVLTTVAESLAGALNLRDAAVLLRQPDGDLAPRGVSQGLRAPGAREALLASAHRPTGTANADGGVWLPLRARGEETGLLYLGPKRGHAEIGPEDLKLAETLANQTAIAIANDLLVEQLQARVAELALLRDRLLHTQETERKKIAEELHDGPLQMVLDLVRQAIAASEALPVTPAGQPGRREQLQQLADRGEDAAYELRAVCVELYPSELKHLGLVAALAGLARRISQAEPLRVTLTHPSFPDDLRLAAEVEEALYRAAREAISNVCRHANASQVQMTLTYSVERITLLVVDDGQGFTPPASYGVLLRGGHVGLLSLRERIERLGGLVHLTSAPGTGTTLLVALPTRPGQPALRSLEEVDESNAPSPAG